MPASVLKQSLPKAIPAVALAFILSGCSTMSDTEYSKQLNTRPMPATSEDVVQECAWIDQERFIINQRIERVNHTKGFTALIAPTVTMQEKRLIRLLNTRSETVGCDESVAS